MGWLSSKHSWTNQAKTPSVRTGIINNTKGWTNQAKKKKCPPVNDCDVKQTLMASAAEQRLWGVRTKKEVREAKRLAATIAAQQKAGRKQAKWPYAGKYDPNKGKKKGRGR